ncbi:HTTM domain-containing protein [Salinirussus salinus]|uniref:HTTM domain-containing protein n=1 Tax=Salinirussus salinus TaxID=1198300 RepID=UPI0013571F40|nr:HTTM domain-containing protein [Salinirussus salinus]
MSLPPATTQAGRSLRRSIRWLHATLARRLGVDPRALAAFRIGLGVVLLGDLLLRSRNLVAFYTDRGILPRSLLEAKRPVISQLSVHALSGDVLLQAGLFLVAGICALALLVGYRTRLAVLVSWLLLVSLHARNPLVLNGGDSLLRRLLFWGVFLPLGSRWSLDTLAGRVRGRARSGIGARERVAGVATAGLLIQVVLVYATNAGFKLGSERWLDGGALAHVFRLDEFTTPLGAALADLPALLGVLEVVWLGLLVASVGLVATTGRRRAVLAGLFVGAHLGMAATMRLGVFPFVSVVALLPFLPSGVWDRVSAAAATVRASSVIGRLPSWLSLPKGEGERDGGRDEPRGELAGRWQRVRARSRKAGQAAGVVLVVGLLVWNAAAVGLVEAPDGVPGNLDPAEDSWDMFAAPPTRDVLVLAPAMTDDGGQVDALHGGAVRWVPPPDGAAWYPTNRWRKYLRSVWATDDPAVLHGVADGLCHRWSRAHDSHVETVSLYAVLEPTKLDGDGPVRRERLVSHSCRG